MRPARRFVIGTILAAALAACAGGPTTTESDDTSAGPTVYGRFSVSVDNVSID